jgi:aromatic-L-amino-acid/L-tryptophan decarboxylase
VRCREMWFTDYGLELSRSFRALKVWMTVRLYGLTCLSLMIEKNISQASYLLQCVKSERRLQVMANVVSNVVCFRFYRPNVSEKCLNRLNENIIFTLHERGICVPSSVCIEGKVAIRCAITNHRTVCGDLDVLVKSVVEIGEELAGDCCGDDE